MHFANQSQACQLLKKKVFLTLKNNRSPVNSLHKSQWRRELKSSSIYTWTNGWANHRDGGDLKRYCAHYNVTVSHNAYRRRTRTSSWIGDAICCPWTNGNKLSVEKKTISVKFEWKIYVHSQKKTHTHKHVGWKAVIFQVSICRTHWVQWRYRGS